MKVVTEKKYSPAGQLAEMLSSVNARFYIGISDYLVDKSLSLKQLHFLSHLAKEDNPTMTDISKMFGISTAAVTGMVDRLEKLGYVERLHATDDRRKVIVLITEKGIEVVDKVQGGLENFIKDLISKGELDMGSFSTVPSLVAACG